MKTIEVVASRRRRFFTSKYPIVYAEVAVKNGVCVAEGEIPAGRFYFLIDRGFPYIKRTITRKSHYLIARGGMGKVVELVVQVPYEEYASYRGRNKGR